MSIKLGILVFSVVVAAAATLDGSPHAKELKPLLNSAPLNTRFSDNILEDASLAVPELVRKYGYPLEVHQVTTQDGYILTLHRIPHGRDQNNDPDVKRPVAFLMHGLLSSSADFVLMGPGNALAYLLAEAGYDVWMGNARGNFYSRKHTHLRPGALFRLTLVTWYSDCHVWVSKFDVSNECVLGSKSLARLIGMGEFLPNSAILTWAGQALCMDEVVFQPICSNVLFLVGGWSVDQQNATMIPLKLGHTPAGASVRQMAHYGQNIANKLFSRFDHGLLKNRRLYGAYKVPQYDLSKITTPVFLHYSPADPLTDERDVDRLFRELGRPVGKFRVPHSRFGHLDFIWGIDAKTLLHDRVINLMQSMDVNSV